MLSTLLLSHNNSKLSLDDIPEDNPLYNQLKNYLATQKSDTFASIAAKDDNDDIKSFEQVDKKRADFHC